MQVVLAGLVEWDCCFVYIDDILVASKSFEEHLHHLQLVFDRLRKADLRLKPTKCLFLCEEVPYLGYVISKHGYVLIHRRLIKSRSSLPPPILQR